MRIESSMMELCPALIAYRPWLVSASCRIGFDAWSFALFEKELPPFYRYGFCRFDCGAHPSLVQVPAWNSGLAVTEVSFQVARLVNMSAGPVS